MIGRFWQILKPPRIMVSDLFEPTKESYLKWWHVEVKNAKRLRWLVSSPAHSCRIFLNVINLEDGVITSTEGMWSTHSGPKETQSLIVDNPPSHIPLVLREPTPSPFTTNDPRRSHEILMRAMEEGQCQTLVTDIQYLAHGQVQHRLTAGQYRIEMIIRTGHKIWNQTKLLLSIPPKGLKGFTLRLIR